MKAIPCIVRLFPIIVLYCFTPSSVKAQEATDDTSIDIAVDAVSNSVKKRILADITADILMRNQLGLATKYGPHLLRWVRGGGVGVFVQILLTPTPAGLGSDVVQKGARELSECDNVSRDFSETRYQDAVDSVDERSMANDQYETSLKSQARQFWMGRYNHNVEKCRVWFESGRTDLFYPS